ncbi:helix-turn-helix domain-containing protein [Gaetbulibacter sp. PBL-D1]|uniref:helix-turn-helix domain-containing protein n=1 Tax=Gaetbulibacter sp. PBL-D1 TaxID=3422594 RepID=UPI003D2E9D5D
MSPEAKIIGFLKELLSNKVISKKKEFYDAIGISRQHFRMIEKEGRRFTSSHIKALCNAYNINANWILGIEEEQYRTQNNEQ